MSENISVCFIWHMHQPLYKDRLSGKYLLPWVRLHAIKDYLDMVTILEEFPKIKQTFNMVPSLLEQLNDYAFHNAIDDQLLLTEKDCSSYSNSEKTAILADSFHCNYDRQIKVNLPYLSLFEKRQHFFDRGQSYHSMLDEFSDQEYADMATWMNLAWFDPLFFESNKELSSYLEQGSNFSQKQRIRLIEIQREIMRKVIPTYKKMQEEGHIEIITSPYYHPILPLLIDSNTAKLPNPQAKLPKRVYFHRDDAIKQLENGLAYYQEMFKVPARGMWPSELAVSPAAIEAIAECGINWIVLDEAMLTRTTDAHLDRDEHGNLNNPELICQPYLLQIGDRKINVFFRELVTSNEISFAYGRREPKEAAQALVMRIKHIQHKLANWQNEGVIVIALDGENCWETYEKDGVPFLREVYSSLSADPTINVSTISQYLSRNQTKNELHNIHSGSWIGSDFHIWIGDPVKNRAWDLLGQTRDFLVDTINKNSQSQENIKRAWEEIYTAEGSDWFWWFGEPNNSAHDQMFDHQFRLRLQNVYKFLGKEYPKDLDVPIAEQVFHTY